LTAVPAEAAKCDLARIIRKWRNSVSVCEISQRWWWRFGSCGMWHFVVGCSVPDVSTEQNAYVCRIPNDPAPRPTVPQSLNVTILLGIVPTVPTLIS